MAELRTPDAKMQAALGAAIVAALWLLRAVRYHPDGLDYALTVREGAGLWHPHHLLYSPIARLIHIASPLDAIAACQLEQILFAVVLVLAAWRLASRLLESPSAGLAAALLLLATRGVLLYATWSEVYVTALAAALLVASEMAAPVPSRLRTAAVLVLAVLLHQMSVLATAGLLIASPRRRTTVAGIAVGGAILLGVYLTAAGSGDPIAFMLRYPLSDVPAWGDFGHFGPEGLAQMGAGLWRTVLPLPTSGTAAAGAAMIAALLAAAAMYLRTGIGRDRLRDGAAAWLFVHLLFVLWWLPAEDDLYVTALAPVWLLGVLAWKNYRVRVRLRYGAPLALAAAGALAAVNLVTTVLPNRGDRGQAYREAVVIHRTAPAGYMPVNDYEVEQNLRYFFGCTVTDSLPGYVLMPAERTERRPAAKLNR